MESGLSVALVRHPMPYGDLEKMRAQRFATLADIDATNPTVEEREEYELPVRLGMVVMAGVDYAEVLKMAEKEADVIIWDGGNNDFPASARQASNASGSDTKARPGPLAGSRSLAKTTGKIVRPAVNEIAVSPA